MRLLFDQNLSPDLVEALSDLFPGADHVSRIDLAHADDQTIWSHAKDHGFAVVSKDADFSDLSIILGCPPKVIWLRLGNSSTRDVESALRSRSGEIRNFLADPVSSLLTIFKPTDPSVEGA